LYDELAPRAVSHGNETTTLRCSVDADSFIQVPFDAPVGGFAHSQAVIIG